MRKFFIGFRYCGISGQNVTKNPKFEIFEIHRNTKMSYNTDMMRCCRRNG